VHKDLHLLIVEASPHGARQLAEELKKTGYEPVFTYIADRESMARALDGSHWDLVLASHDTPGFGALAALELLIEKRAEIPLIVVSKSGPDERAIEAMRLGARDFVTLNHLPRLAAVVERELAGLHATPSARKIFDSSPMPMWVYDVESLRFLAVNPAAIRHYGYSREEFLAMTLKQIRPPEDVPRLMEALATIGPGVVDAGVWRHRKKDGTLIHCEIHIQELNYYGRPAEMTMIVDVTDRWQRQQDLAAQARVAGLVSESSMVLSWAQTLREGLQGCTEILQRQVETTCAQIWILKEAEGALEMDAGTGPCTLAMPRVRVGESDIGRVAAERKPHVRFASGHAPVCGGQCLQSTRSAAFAGHPLMVEDRLVGVLAAYSDRAFDRGAMQALASVAGAVAQFIERKRAEEALRDSEERVRLLLDSITEAIYGVDLDGTCTLANRACLEKLGYQHASQIIGQKMHNVIHHSRPDGTPYPVEECSFADKFRKGLDIQSDVEVFWRADGTSFPAACRSYPVRKGGEITGAVVTFTDITERKRAEQEQRKLASIVENSEDFISIATPAGEIVYINPGGCRMAGIDDPRELAGQPMSVLAPSPFHPWLQEEVLPDLMANGRWEGESMLRNLKTGATIDVSIRASVVRHAETGEPICIAAVVRDIRQRKQTERALMRAKETAEAASRAKTEFLANVSHEIRTPMNGIIGMTELALETDLTLEQRDYIENVRKSAEYLLAVINEVLDFSKIEAGKMSLDPCEFALHASVEEAVRSLSLRAHQKGLELLCRIAPDVPASILADSYRLRQILINLLGNAVKFTGSGEILLEVKLVSRRGARATLEFSVRDTGPGIAFEKQQMIFEAFTQADGSMTRRYGGTGLGLAISRHLVRLMGGRMWLESEPGAGSTFSFTIQAIVREPAPPRASPPLEHPARLLRGVRVLIVDDNSTNRRILEQYVAQWEMLSGSAASAAAGLALLLNEKAAHREFQLVLLDARMPEADGFSLARSIRNHPELARAAIMMLSSDDLHADAQKCREAGIDVYLVKPVMQRDLRDAILRVLKIGPAPELPKPASSVAAGEAAAGLRVLLAEDNIVNQKVALSLLEKRGYAVTLARDGARAVEEHARHRFDLILMDLQMPEMGGLEATRVIRDRERETGRHVPIIALTAHAMKGDRERCLEAGMDDYVSKPIQPGELFETIARVAAARVPLHSV